MEYMRGKKGTCGAVIRTDGVRRRCWLSAGYLAIINGYFRGICGTHKNAMYNQLRFKKDSGNG